MSAFIMMNDNRGSQILFWAPCSLLWLVATTKNMGPINGSHTVLVTTLFWSRWWHPTSRTGCAVGGTLTKFFVEGLPKYLNKQRGYLVLKRCAYEVGLPSLRPHHTPLVVQHFATVARMACGRGEMMKQDIQIGLLNIEYQVCSF
jgi:hypothetical protein